MNTVFCRFLVFLFLFSILLFEHVKLYQNVSVSQWMENISFILDYTTVNG